MITAELIYSIKDQLRIDWRGIHGLRHWARVYHNGMKLAPLTGANIAVIQLFSIFHDACRITEGGDPEHGPRGADLAESLAGNYFHLDKKELDLLIEACRHHTMLTDHRDCTVKTCFDADRLDLGRVGIIPDPQLLCTREARTPENIKAALHRSETDFLPDNMIARTYLQLIG